ncbi:MAG: hypothetical protein K0R31_119 [Clostridiales bacterium]|jgi:hypothetical protein|nr:hypothetical protein [Clostridiales bacterium]
MKTFIKLVVVVVLSIMFGSTTVSAATVKATYVVVESTVDDDIYSSTKMNTFIIGEDTYVLLSDLAYILDGTLSTFDITSGSSEKAIKIITQRQYTAKTLSSLLDMKEKTKNKVTIAKPKVYINGNKTKLTAYTIDNNMYFKLKDLAKVFEFTYKVNSNKLTIKTSDKALFNGLPYYLTQTVSADGKTTSTDASIKKQFGDPLPVFTFKNDGTYTVVRSGKTFQGKITNNNGDTFEINTIGDPKAKSGTKYLVYMVGDTYKISTNFNIAYSDGYLLTPSLKTVDLTSGAQTPTSDQAVTYPPGTSPDEINKAISDYMKENGIPNPTDPSKQ